MVTAVYPGRFDPITYGHLDIIIRASSLFDMMLIAVKALPGQETILGLNERINIMQKLLFDLPNVRTLPCCDDVLVFARKNKAQVIIRGLLNIRDFEKESERAKLNKERAPEIENVFVVCRPDLFYSSDMIKEVAAFGGDISKFVPPDIVRRVCALRKQVGAVKHGQQGDTSPLTHLSIESEEVQNGSLLHIR